MTSSDHGAAEWLTGRAKPPMWFRLLGVLATASLASRGLSCQTMRFGFVGCLACGEPFYAVPCGAADMSAHKGAEKVDDRYPATRLATSTGLAASAARLDPAAAAAPGDCV